MDTNEKKTITNKKFKIAYAFTLIIAIGALMFTKVSTEKNLGNISSLENNTTQNQKQNVSMYLRFRYMMKSGKLS